MQVWNVLHAARCKYRTQKVVKNRHLGTITQLCQAISSQPRHVSTIGKKIVKQQYLLHMFSQYGELRPTSGWDRSGSLRHPCKFQRVSRLGSVTAWHSSTGRQPNFVALNRGRHLYLAGRPSRWALAHILVLLDLLPRIFRLLFPSPSIQRGISNHSISDDLGRSSRSFIYCITARCISRWMLPHLSQSVELNCSSTSAAVFMHCSVLCAQSNPTSSVMTTEVQPSLKLH